MTKNVKNFVELHFAHSEDPVLIKVDMIGYMYPVTEDSRDRHSYKPAKKVNWTHITSLAHNNGGFDVKEPYTKVVELIRQAQEA